MHQLVNDLARNHTALEYDPRAVQMSEDDARELAVAQSQGFASVAEYRAAIKAKFSEDRRQREADEEAERIIDGIHSLKALKTRTNQVEDDIYDLEAKASKLQKTIAAPSSTESSIADDIKSGAIKLLVSLGLVAAAPVREPESLPDESGDIDAAQLQMRLAAERRAAAIATEALAVVQANVATKRRHLEVLKSKQDYHVRRELDHLSTRLTADYLSAIANVEKAYSRLVACGYALDEVRGSYGNGWPNAETFEFPRVPTMPDVHRNRLTVAMSGEDVQRWRDIAATLAKNPDADIIIKD
jgi:hypothetical protein